MNFLEPYKGRYVSAESASNELDVDCILSGCQSVLSTASNLSDINNKVFNLGCSITPQALSIDGVTVTDNLSECCDGIKNVESYISSTVEAIKEAAISAYNEIQTQLNEDARCMDEQQIQENSKED